MTPEQYEAIRLDFIKAAMQGMCADRSYCTQVMIVGDAIAIAEATLKAAGVERPEESDAERLQRGREMFDENWKAMAGEKP